MSPVEILSYQFLAIVYWLIDPIPWIVIAFALLLLRRWPRSAFLISVLLGTATGLAIMCCINGCRYPGHASFIFAVIWALVDAIIQALVLTVLFRLARRSFERDRLK
jgi:hypothetical protein